MAIPSGDIEVSFVFDLSDANNPVIVATDNTDYATLGYSSGVDGRFTPAVGPAGVFYNNPHGSGSSDINPFVSRVKNLPCPVDSDGNPLVGNYAITYSIQTTADGPSVFFTRTFEFDVDWAAHTLEVSQSVNCNTSSLISVAQKDWGPDSTVEAFEHTVDSPEVDGVPVRAPLVNTLAQNVITPIYRSATSPYVTTATATVLFEYTGYSVREVLEGTASVKVICKSLCCFTGAIKELYSRYTAACSNNPPQIAPLGNQLLKVGSLLDQWNLALQCGDTCELNVIETKLKEILGDCNCGCSDCEETDGWITAVANSSNTNGGVNITVSAPLILTGSALSLDPTFVAQVNANTTAITALQSAVAAIVQSKYILLPDPNAPVGTGANTTLTTLKSLTVPANSVSANGDKLRVTAIFTFANNTNSKRVLVNIGGTTYKNTLFTGANADGNIFASRGITWVWEFTRLASGTLLTFTEKYNVPYPMEIGEQTGVGTALDFTQAITLEARGQNGTATANNIVCQSLTAEIFKA